MAKINTTDRFPWNEIVGVTDAALGDCVRIPKIFVKNSVDGNGLITRMISNVKLKGYHCHPAFMQNGHERNAILIKKALESESNPVTFDVAKTAETAFKTSHGVDYHIYNIYEHHLIALLMLIEYGTTDLYTAMSGSDETANWYGLTQHWGDVNLFVDGIDTKGTDGTARIFDNFGNFTLQDTDYLIGNYGYPTKLATNSGEKYNFNDIFISDRTSFSGGNSGNNNGFNGGSLGVWQSLGSGESYLIGIENNAWAVGKDCGAFMLTDVPSSTTGAYRIAKFAD